MKPSSVHSLGRVLLCGAILAAVASKTTAAPLEAGVSRALAQERAARISNLHYTLAFTLKEHSGTVAGTETVTFDSKAAGDLPIDYRDGTLTSAELNGQPISTALDNGHLHLAAIAGQNTLTIAFTSNAAAAGKAFTRYEDKDDGSEYLYTLFVPMDASMAFPCFDQPDLKGRFSLQVEHPTGWTVIANTAATNATDTHAEFAETRPISTYLFAFTAGPWARLPSQKAGEPDLYARKSQMAQAKQEAPQVQQMAARGIAYFQDYFAQPFPFPKYDLVLIPGFPFGGMEHAGATFLNEDSVLFRSTPTASDYFRRNILILHETCHQWFGDLVTMRWFNDLWLKEGFAQYMAYKALAELEPASNPWKHFYEEIKPLAYGIDETQGTTPIFQNIANLKDAKSAYGAIVYQKAPAILKQLDYFLGNATFRDGLRIYLEDHAYGNAEWSDLVQAFEQANTKAGHPQEVQTWATSWITYRGMPEVTVDFACSAGKITHLTLSQRDVLGDGHLWPMANQILLITPPRGNAPTGTLTLKVKWNSAHYPVAEATGKACPSLVFANEGDYGYGRFLLDKQSGAVAPALLVPASGASLPPSVSDPLRRTMLWGALWENVHVAQSAPSAYLDLALKSLPTEADESLARIQGGRVAKVLHDYLSDASRAKSAPQAESVVAGRMLHAPDLGLRIVNFRTFTSISETPAALQQIKDLLSGKLAIPDLTLKPLDRWNLIGHLMMMGDPEAQMLYSAELAHDSSGQSRKYAYAAAAGAPTAQAKALYFEQYLHSTVIQEDWITLSLRPFNSWNQADLTSPYLKRALDQLPEIKAHRKIFFLGAWLSAFLDGQKSAWAQDTVKTWLAAHQTGPNALDPDLRLKVLEAADALDRTVLIRQRFPD